MGRVTVIDGDRITLPREFREQRGIRKGDLLEYRVDNKSLVLSKPTKIEDPTKRLFGIGSGVAGDVSGDALFFQETRAKLRRAK